MVLKQRPLHDVKFFAAKIDFAASWSIQWHRTVIDKRQLSEYRPERCIVKPTHHSIAHLWDKGERVKAMAKEAELDEADTDDPGVDDESSSGRDKVGGGDGGDVEPDDVL